MSDAPRSRRPNRTSTHYKGKDGWWYGKVWMGTKPDGSPDRRHRRRRDEAGIIAAIRQLEQQRAAGAPPKPGKAPKLADWCVTCLDDVLPNRGKAPKTIQGYRSLVRTWIVPALGQERITQIRPDQIEAIYTTMRKAGKAPNHVRNVHSVLRSFLGIAKRQRLISSNPAELVEPPRASEGAKKHLTRREARKVIAASQAEGRRNSARWPFGLALGARQGEVLGLRWPSLIMACAECGDVMPLTEWWSGKEEACESCGVLDMEPQARLWWQVQRLTWAHGCADVAACTEGKHRRPCPARCPKAKRTSGKRHVCVPKTAPGLCPKDCGRHASTCPQRTGGGLIFREIKERRRKTVGLAPELVELLKAQRTTQAAERLAAGNLWEDHGVVFAQWNGRPIDPRQDWEEWAGILKAAGLEHLALHAGRHTAATLALEAGVALAVVQEMLGHADIRVTRGYTHVASPLMQDGARRLGKSLFGG